MTHLESYHAFQEIAMEWAPKWRKVGEKKDWDTKLKVCKMVEHCVSITSLAGDDRYKERLLKIAIHLMEIVEELVEKNILPENTYLIICKGLAEVINY
tara:strand:- start:37 stop:330 length:294 start_codon:yes stop_codon:yes gene_type:complete